MTTTSKKLSEKQLKALDALLDERAPSAEQLRTQLLNNMRNIALRHYEGDELLERQLVGSDYSEVAAPTLEEIDARVAFDGIEWVRDDGVVGACFDDAHLKAMLGAWKLSVWRYGTGRVWYWKISRRTEDKIVEWDPRETAPTLDEAKNRCIAKQRELEATP